MRPMLIVLLTLLGVLVFGAAASFLRSPSYDSVTALAKLKAAYPSDCLMGDGGDLNITCRTAPGEGFIAFLSQPDQSDERAKVVVQIMSQAEASGGRAELDSVEKDWQDTGYTLTTVRILTG